MIAPQTQPTSIVGAQGLARSIVDTIREPLLVLDKHLRIVTANRSFYLTFGMNRWDVEGRPIHALGDGEWNIPELRSMLREIASRDTVMEGYEIEREFAGIGQRTMLLNARRVFYEDAIHTTILLAIEDITERRLIERGLKDSLQLKDVFLQEIQHRVANSLQIIASILLLKAGTISSQETRSHLHDAHRRILSIAAMQRHLSIDDPTALVQLGTYLSQLCETLADSMVGDGGRISIEVHADRGTATPRQSVSIGLIVTELVINALKHAFPAGRTGGKVIVRYQHFQPHWKLTVSDNGIGRAADQPAHVARGLGTAIVEALAEQLGAQVETSMDALGTRISVAHTAVTPGLSSQAA